MKPSSATDSVNIGILLQRVLSSLASNRCYACRWTMRHGGGCEPFNCSMRYSEYGTVAMAEKDGWLKRTEEMADVLRCFTSANSPFVRSEIAMLDPDWCMDTFWRVNPGGNATVPSLYLLHFAREVLRVHGARLSATAESARDLDSIPLRCEAVGGVLDMRIGEKVLAFATDICPALWDGEKDRQLYRVKDAAVFAKEVADELNREGEDGSTPLSRLLDKCIVEAVEQGAEGVEEIK